MRFWLDELVRRSKIPYPVSFTIISITLYLFCIPIMIYTSNLQQFLHDPRWILLTIFGAYNGILVIYIYRKFTQSLDNIKHLIKNDYNKVKKDTVNSLLNKRYWIASAFWVLMNALVFEKDVQEWYWGTIYNQTETVSVCYFLSTLPHMIIIGIFFYLIIIGLPYATRNLSEKNLFKQEKILEERVAPFHGFKRLITILILAAAFYAVLPPNIWSSITEVSPENQWVTISEYAPYIGGTVLLVAILFPHYFFHRILHSVKEDRVLKLQEKLSRIKGQKLEDNVKRMLLMFEEEKVERMKTWLIDIEVVGEVLIVALMHVILVEILTHIIH